MVMCDLIALMINTFQPMVFFSRAIFIELEKKNYFSTYGYMRFNSLDDKYFLTHGFLFEGDFHWIVMESSYKGDFSPFSIAKAKMGFATPITHNLSFDLFTEGAFHLGN